MHGHWHPDDGDLRQSAGGLLLAGSLIARFGYTAMATGYCLFSILFVVPIAPDWRRHLWQSGAANLR